MTKQVTAPEPAPETMPPMPEPQEQPGGLGEAATAWVFKTDDPKAQEATIHAVGAALAAFKPTDEIEGMMAAQAVAAHLGAMECLRRAMIPEQPGDQAARLRKDGANLMRAMTDMVAALDRKRGKTPQVVRVERVTVHEGGQAIVGNVSPKLGGQGHD